nr:fibrobacter succinogenes major paralogous domain-containing protein [uncultured Flavobacterium sp.]
MKKLIYLLSITFLMLLSCSSGDNSNSQGNNNSSTTVSDIDGNVYSIVKICNQTWMKSNLNVSKYRNGDIIPQVTNTTQWASLTTGAWCYYRNITANGVVYGKLYNWYAVNDSRGLAPQGYHIPTQTEWNSIINCLGGDGPGGAGGKMKEAGYSHWVSPNAGATNSSGFTALPGRLRTNLGDAVNGDGTSGNWWSSSQFNSADAFKFDTGTEEDYAGIFHYPKSWGCSVRCVKD